MKVFFDVDGVLIDGWHADEARRKPWDATIEADLCVDRSAFQLLFFGTPGNRSASPMFECVTGHRDLKQALAAILPQAGYNGCVDAFVRYWFEKDSRINSEVFKIVRELRERGGAETFVATGQEHHRAAYLWNELGFASHFDRLFYSAELGVPKKDMRFFEAINGALGIEPGERPLFFDDQPEIVELANRAGWDAVTFTSVLDVQQHPRLRYLWT